MLKPLTLSLSLAVALGACSVSMAGIFASPQCASPQTPCASPQCDVSCPPRKHCFTLPKFHFPKPVCSYEWVLRRKITWTHGDTCNPCGGAIPSAQCPSPSPQGVWGSGQTYGSGQAAYPTTYGSGQATPFYGGSGQATVTAPSAAGQMTPAAPSGDEAPPAPVAPEAPSAPAPSTEAPAPPAPSAPGPQSSLLFSTPSGN